MLQPISARADTINWTLGASGSWDVAANWTDTTNSSHVVPTSADAVTVSGQSVTKTGGIISANILALQSGATLTLNGNTGFNIAQLILASSDLNPASNQTFGAGTLVHGSGRLIALNGPVSLANQGTISADVAGNTLSIGNGGSVITLSNSGTLQAISGGTLTLGGSTSLTNTGLITASGASSTVNLNGSFTNTGTISAVSNGLVNLNATYALGAGSVLSTSGGGQIRFNTTLNNAGSTFDAVNTVGGTNNYLFNSSTLSGGSLTNSGSLKYNSVTLNNVALDAGLNIGSGQGIGLAGTTALPTGSTTTLSGGDLSLVSSQTFGAGTLVHGSGRLIAGNGPVSVANQGTISADVAGNTLSIGPGYSVITLSNSGTLQAISGGTLTLGTSTSLTNTANITADGTALVSGNVVNSTVNINGPLVLNNGSVLTTTNGGVININGTTTNAGTITLNRGTLGRGTNTGTISITGPVNLGGDFSSSGSLGVDGTLGGGFTTTITGGTLSGRGTIVGNVVNNGGSISPAGTSTGKLTINGNYSQAAGGSLTIDLGGYGKGVSYDWLSLSGSASLNGLLNVDLTNGFIPAVGDTFTFFNYASHTGAFSGVNSLNNGYAYDVTYLGTSAQLRLASVTTATPEPGALGLLIGIGGFGAALLARRRKRKAA